MTEQAFAKRTNWAGNVTFAAADFQLPSSVEELQTAVRNARLVKPVGARHSFNRSADTDGEQFSTGALNRILKLDTTSQTVTVECGILHGHLSVWLNQRGYALHNLASLPHISVAGACATGTHGSGDSNGNLSTAVQSLDLIRPDGELISLARGQHGFAGAVVGIGALGIVARLTLDVEPAFNVAQTVYERLPFVQVQQHFDKITSSGYSVSMFTDWMGDTVNQLWVKRRMGDVVIGDAVQTMAADQSFFGASAAPAERHPLDGHSAENCTAQLGVGGPWHERLPHFRMDFTPSSGQELQAEYFVARGDALAALESIRALRDSIQPLLYISEIRTVAADDLWLSMCYQRDSVALHFTFKPDMPAVLALLPRIERALAPFHPRPHWGKLFTMDSDEVRAGYPRFAEFDKLRRACDPDDKMSNSFLTTLMRQP